MEPRYTNIKIIDDEPSKLQRLFKLIIILGALGISCAALYTLITFARADEEIITESAPRYGTINELTDLEVFTQAYLSVNCDDTLLKNTQTIRVTGHMVHGDQNQPFSLIKKRPDYVLFSTSTNSRKTTVGVSNGTVWRRIQAPQKDDQFSLLEGTEADVWLRQRRFFDWIISASLGDGRITGIETVIWEDVDYLKVNILDTDGEVIHVLVDPQTMHPHVELQTLSDGTTTQSVFSDYRDINGMPIPFSIESSTNGEPTSLITLDKAALNSGVLSQLFEIPQSLLTIYLY